MLELFVILGVGDIRAGGAQPLGRRARLRMSATGWFLAAWVAAVIAWELYAVITRRVLTISYVLSRLPRWARWVIVLVWIVLVLHWWIGCAGRAPGDPLGWSRPTEMRAVCLQLQDVNGKTFHRTAWFNDRGYELALRYWAGEPGLCTEMR